MTLVPDVNIRLMDLIYRKEKYRKFLQKISKLQDDPSVEQSPVDHKKFVQDSVNEILNDLKDKSDITEIRILYVALLVPLLLVLIYHSWLTGIGASFVYLALIIIFFIAASLTMKKNIQANRDLKWDNPDQKLSSETYLSNKINYVASAIKIKEQRLLLLILFYSIFFAPLLVFTFVIALQKHAFGHTLTDLIVAYIISAPVWYYVYMPDRDELLETEEELYNLQDKLQEVAAHTPE